MTVTEALERIFAVLAVTAAAGVAALWIARVLGRRSPALAQLVAQFGTARYWLGALVAAVCMGGSLYFSIGAHFVPCRLCWIQRGFMYPLVLLLGYAAASGARPGTAPSGLPLRAVGLGMSLVGLAVSTYHVILEHNPQLETNVCDVATPCTQIWFKEFGFVTLPVMAWCGFAFIATVLALPATRRTSPAPADLSPNRLTSRSTA